MSDHFGTLCIKGLRQFTVDSSLVLCIYLQSSDITKYQPDFI